MYEMSEQEQMNNGQGKMSKNYKFIFIYKYLNNKELYMNAYIVFLLSLSLYHLWYSFRKYLSSLQLIWSSECCGSGNAGTVGINVMGSSVAGLGKSTVWSADTVNKGVGSKVTGLWHLSKGNGGGGGGEEGGNGEFHFGSWVYLKKILIL